MADWIDKPDAFLQFNDYEILTHAGKVSQVVVKKLAEKEYEKFKVQQDKTFESDFEKEVKRLRARREMKK